MRYWLSTISIWGQPLTAFICSSRYLILNVLGSSLEKKFFILILISELKCRQYCRLLKMTVQTELQGISHPHNYTQCIEKNSSRQLAGWGVFLTLAYLCHIPSWTYGNLVDSLSRFNKDFSCRETLPLFALELIPPAPDFRHAGRVCWVLQCINSTLLSD